MGELLKLIGNTPSVRLKRLVELYGVDGELFLKLECFNPTGSLKDRVALWVVRRSLEEGLLKEGMSLLEATTGNTGISLAFVGALMGHRVVLVIPEEVGVNVKRTCELFGAQVIPSPGGNADMDVALRLARDILESEPGKFLFLDQYSHPSHVECSYRWLGPELCEQLGGEIDAFVDVYGSGSTFTGVARCLKERRPDAKAFLVEPAECPVVSKGMWGPHMVDGVSDGFIPDNLELDLVDGVVLVNTEEVIRVSRELAELEGIAAGPSSGANVAAALKLLKGGFARRVATIANDRYDRYFEHPLFGKARRGTSLGPKGPAPLESLKKLELLWRRETAPALVDEAL